MKEFYHKFTMGAEFSLMAVKQTDDFLTSLDQAVSECGDAVHSLFSEELSQLNEIFKIIRTGGDTVWVNGIDTKTDLPIRYVVNGEYFFNVGVVVTDHGKRTLEDGTTIDVEIGYFYANLVHGDNVTQVAAGVLQYIGDGIPNLEADNGFKKIITKNLKTTVKFVKGLIEKGAVGDSVGAVKEAARVSAQSAAKSASTEEQIAITSKETITARIEFSAADVFANVIGLGLIILSIILDALEKQIKGYCRVYNNTKTELNFTVCYVKADSALVTAPSLPNAPVYLSGTSPAWTPAPIIGFDPIHYVDLSFANTDTLHGLGYVLKARPTGDFPGFAVMVDIPNVGDNSMGIDLRLHDDCYNYWKDESGDNKGLTLTATSGKYTLRIATNQVDGKSASPLNGALGYNYEHLVVLEESASSSKMRPDLVQDMPEPPTESKGIWALIRKFFKKNFNWNSRTPK